MERLEFIENVFTLFRVNPENNRQLALIYDSAFTTQKRVDWDKLFKAVMNEAETGGLPKPGWFISKFDLYLKPTNYTTQNGIKIRINLKDGYKYDYETYQNNLSLEEIKRKAMRKFKDTFASMQMFDETELQWVTI